MNNIFNNILLKKNIEIKYVLVTLNTVPFATESKREVGYYLNKHLAQKVWRFLHDVSDNKNMEIIFEEYVDKCIYSNDGSIRLQHNNKVICDKLDRKEYLRLINIEIKTDIESMKDYQLKIKK